MGKYMALNTPKYPVGSKHVDYEWLQFSAFLSEKQFIFLQILHFVTGHFEFYKLILKSSTNAVTLDFTP